MSKVLLMFMHCKAIESAFEFQNSIIDPPSEDCASPSDADYATAKMTIAALSKGGRGIAKYNEMFGTLLPHAVIGILDVVRTFVKEDAPGELKKPEDTLSNAINAANVHGNTDRVLTMTYVCPFAMEGSSTSSGKRVDFVVLCAHAFEKRVCSWIGDVRDHLLVRAPLIVKATVPLSCKPIL